MAVFRGDETANTLQGGDGDDILIGLAAGDTLDGGDGNDVLYGFDTRAPRIDAVQIADGFLVPLFATAPDGDADRLFVIERRGQIEILDLATGARSIFLDISPEVSIEGEQGLLGAAFDPDYANNGFFYVQFTNLDGDSVVRRYQVSADPDVADATSGAQILSIEQPFDNHNGGWIGFGPDGYLYIASGDGGGAGDPSGNGQNTETLLGKMLRVDVSSDDFPGDPDRNYAIPPDNPFVGGAGADEIWDIGLRNPFRASFDRETGDLYIGDVGQRMREEIDLHPAGVAGGLNFGWGRLEGNTVFNANETLTSPATDPLVEYAHLFGPPGGDSVTGGYVNRGPGGLEGHYFYADFLRNQLWTLKVENGLATNVVDRTNQVNAVGSDITRIVSFAEGADGQLYIVDIDGDIFRLDIEEGYDTDGQDTLIGGGGNDRLDGGPGADDMDGGAGDDVFIVDHEGDVVTDSSGTDRIQSSITFALPETEIEDLVLSGSGNLDGTGNDLANKIIGTVGENVLRGEGGNDILRGGLGIDRIYGGDGDDLLDAGAGADGTFQYVYGEAGNDLYVYGRGDGDVFLGFLAEDATTGTADRVKFYDLDLADIDLTIFDYTGTGAAREGEAIRFMWSDNTDSGELRVSLMGAFIERFEFADGAAFDAVRVAGAAGGVTDGTAGDDLVGGSDGNDFLMGLTGADHISAKDGNDIVVGGAGADHLDGGAGVDWLQYLSSDAGVSIDLRLDGTTGQQSASGGDAIGDTIIGFERVYASMHRDTVTGDNGNNVLVGLAGKDSLFGKGGADILRGGAGGDNLNGGTGEDWIQYVESTAGVTISLEVDTLTNRQSASGGYATGDQILNFERVQGSEFDDIITGNAGKNFLVGRGGIDMIEGGGGEDLIRGGADNDALSGGADADRFIFTTADGADVIDDFENGSDLIQFAATGLSYAQLQVSDSGPDTLIDYGSGTIRLSGIDSGQIDEADFMFT